MKKRIKKGIVLPALDDVYIKKAFEVIERIAPHLTCGMMSYKKDLNLCKILLSECDILSLCWYEDFDFLYWGHEVFTRLKWPNYLGEL